MDILNRCVRACREKPGVVVFPDSLDHRVLAAAAQLKDEGLAEPVLMNSPFAVREKLRGANLSPAGLTVVDHSSPALLKKNAETFFAIRQEKGKPVTEEDAEKAMHCPLAASAM